MIGGGRGIGRWGVRISLKLQAPQTWLDNKKNIAAITTFFSMTTLRRISRLFKAGRPARAGSFLCGFAFAKAEAWHSRGTRNYLGLACLFTAGI
jgi:hypothetical protein